MQLTRPRAILGAALFLAVVPAMLPEPASGAENWCPWESLAGEWAFRLDPSNKGIEEKWFDAALPDRIKLPGSTDEGGYGTKNTRPPDFKYLARLVEYTGPAWYQREIEISATWKGKRITLFLERCHWESQVWLDGKPLGMQDSLCVPHVYELGVDLAPGKHRLALRIDNTKKYDVGKDVAHSVSEQTQTNWNGVIGRIELRATDPVWIEDVQVYPDVEKKSTRVRVMIGNATGNPASGTLEFVAVSPAERKTVARKPVEFKAAEGRTVVEADMALGDAVTLWDEFSPALYRMVVTLNGRAGDTPVNGEGLASFGMRKLSITPSKQLALNGRTIFLRGTLECCIFPLTGYPPMDVDGWLRVIRTAKSYGLNHLRFHSWCPPEAAFEAADREGFLFHVESPLWVHNLGKDKPRDDFVREEWLRILRAYGNHPSFGLFCVGNELNGDIGYLSGLVKLGQQTDPRHLYTSSTAWSLVPENEYNVVPIRGLRGPKTDHDFRADDAKHAVPVISHEIGQWTVYPNLEEIKKYTGVLRARNFEAVRDDLKAKHMLDLAPDFFLATGKLSVLLYKEEMEVLLRTPGHSGFQLLDLHDFPGQGTALIGALDPFWDSKGLIKPEEWRRFCGPTVPLLRMPKRTYTTGETFSAAAEIAHFGPADLKDAAPVWSIKDERGAEVAAGAFDRK
ncbi:MAG: glycoside hydrolase family 2, partial [Planctomycetota bacterium]|nr:glycoside hydrolase family 2 [Planctomycetota bacterium]